jgi:hypothetical protein
MKLSIVSTVLLMFGISANAEIGARLQHRPAEGFDDVLLRNDSAFDLVAFVISANRTSIDGLPATAKYLNFSDPLIDSTAKAVPPGEERVVLTAGFRLLPLNHLGRRVGPARPNPTASRSIEEPIAVAGILANGATVGDPALLTRLLARRSSMLQAVDVALETLLDAGRRNVARNHLIEQFQKLANAVHRSYLPPEQRAGHTIYQSMVGKLMNLPEAEPGAPFPPSAFVAEETAILNRRRVALLESQPNLFQAFQ